MLVEEVEDAAEAWADVGVKATLETSVDAS